MHHCNLFARGRRPVLGRRRRASPTRSSASLLDPGPLSSPPFLGRHTRSAGSAPVRCSSGCSPTTRTRRPRRRRIVSDAELSSRAQGRADVTGPSSATFIRKAFDYCAAAAFDGRPQAPSIASRATIIRGRRVRSPRRSSAARIDGPVDRERLREPVPVRVVADGGAGIAATAAPSTPWRRRRDRRSRITAAVDEAGRKRSRSTARAPLYALDPERTVPAGSVFYRAAAHSVPVTGIVTVPERAATSPTRHDWH